MIYSHRLCFIVIALAMLLLDTRVCMDRAVAEDQTPQMQDSASTIVNSDSAAELPEDRTLEKQQAPEIITTRLKEIKQKRLEESGAPMPDAPRETVHINNYVEELPTRLKDMPLSRPLGMPVTPTQARMVFQQPSPEAPGLAEDLQVPPEDSPIFKPAADLEQSAEVDEEQVEEDTGPALSEEEIKLAKTYKPLDVHDTLERADEMLDRDRNAITLETLYHEIIYQHPDLEIALAAVMEKEGNIIISEAQGNPKAGVDAYLGPYWTMYPNGTPSSLDWGSFSSYITQTLYDFGAIKNNITSDECTKESATLKLHAAMHSVVVLITQYYLNAIQAQEVVMMRYNEVTFYKDLRDVFLKRQKAGTGLMTDVQKLDVSLKRAESNLINEMKQLKTFRDMLSTLLDNQPVGWVITDSVLFSKNMNASLKDLQSQAIQRNLNLQSINKDIEATQFKIKSMNLDMLPKFGYKIAGGYQAEYPSESFYTGAQATISWNIHDGGEHDGQVLKLRATLRKQKASYKNEKNAMIDRIKGSYNDYYVASKDLELAHNGKDLSIALTKNYLKEFDIGLRTLLDLVAAKEGEIEADLREINSRFRCVTGLMRLYNEVGLIDRYLPIPEDTVNTMAKDFGITLSDIKPTAPAPVNSIEENKEPIKAQKWVHYE